MPPARVRHFAVEAGSLDAAEVKDITSPKRYTLLDGDPSDAETGPLVKQVVAQHGDIRQLLASCEAIAAYI